MRIIPLDSSHKGTKLLFRYSTNRHYRAVVACGPGGFGVSFMEETLSGTLVKEFDGTLLEDWLENPLLFAMEHGDRHIGYVELDHERWNNRVRVTNLWVEEGRRRDGVGRALLAKAEEEARALGARCMVLETQSSNWPALCFYRAMGFAFTGCDLTAYSDDDVERGEVRLELAKVFGRGSCVE
jgi:Acetyltransferases